MENKDVGQKEEKIINMRKYELLVKPQNEEREKYIQNIKSNPLALAIESLKDFQPFVRCQGSLYVFNGKHYDLISDKEIDQIFNNFCCDHNITASYKYRNLFVSAINSYGGIKNIDKFNDYKNLMCLNNGILDINTREISPHSPLFYFNSAVNIDYEQNNFDCPNFENYLKSTFNDDQHKIDNVIMIGGYLLDSSIKAEKMFFFLGDGSAGKSLLTKVYSLFFTEEQNTALSLEQIADENSFKRAKLINSRLNISTETKDAYLNTEEIKKIVTGDAITVDIKHKEPITLIPNLKIIGLSNNDMKFNDLSEGIFRRILIVKFTTNYITEQEFANKKNAAEKGYKVKDRFLIDKLILEKNAIFNLFLDGLLMLKSRNYTFIENEETRNIMNEMKKDGDSVREFLEDNYEEDDNSLVLLSDVYNDYKNWYYDHVQAGGVFKLKDSGIAKRIQNIFRIKSAGKLTVDGKRGMAYNLKKIVYEEENMTDKIDF